MLPLLIAHWTISVRALTRERIDPLTARVRETTDDTAAGSWFAV